MSDSTFVLSGLDILIIAGSLLLVVVVGLWASRGKSATAHGYFLASGRMPWWIIGTAFVSTSVSSVQIVGTVGAVYQDGMAIVNWEWWSLPTYSLLMGLFIPVYLQNRITTVPDYLNKRFGPLCGDIYSWVMMLAYVIVFLAPALYSSTVVVSSVTGWSFQAVLWGTVLLVGLYTVKGGLAAVMWTDAVECVMLLGGGIVLYFVAIAQVPGGWGAMVAANPERFHLYRPPRDTTAPFLGLICGSLGGFLFYQASNQVMIQRVLAARSTWDGLMGIVFAGFINFFRPFVTSFLGFIVFYWVEHLHRAPPLQNLDAAFPFALTEFASGYGLRGIILAGFLAAVMASVSALANSTATIFALDIYKRMIRRNGDERQVVRVGRVVALLALAIAGLLCPEVKHMGIFRYTQTGVTMVATPFISVCLLGILWKRANYPGAIFGVVGGLAIQCAVALGAPLLGFKLHWLYLGFIAEVIIMACVVAVSLATAPPDEERVAPFVWRPELLASRYKGAARPWYQGVGIWFGIYAMIWCFLYWRFW